MKTRLALLLSIIVLTPFTAAATDTSYLYKTTLVQAAPGRILEVIDLYKAAIAETKDEPPLWMRHSRGDHWDLLLLFPIKSYEEYYSRARRQ